MHIPNVDRPLDDEEWQGFVQSQGFGHLIAPGAGRDLPVVVPTQYVYEEPVVLAHVAVGNPVLAALRERPSAMLSVAGDWAFIPSSWKVLPGEDPRLGIPTTYYAAVQLSGRVEVVDEPDALAEVLRRQLRLLQGDVDIADPGVAQRARLRGIRGLVLHVEDVAAKFKFGGNVDEAHRRAVLEHLEERAEPRDAAAAARLRRRLSGPDARRSSFRR